MELAPRDHSVGRGLRLRQDIAGGAGTGRSRRPRSRGPGGPEARRMANTQTEQFSDDGRLLVPLAKLRPVEVRALRLP
ncbi:MAG: hypothetical protein WAM82_18675 [Thermoanaerobaculia bacterium]